jgi:flavin-dependent dehydrogenase
VYDAVVVGARCAGAATAMLLARAGHRVLMVDRARFPSDTFRNHAILHPGVRALRDWGLLERVKATGCPPLRDVVHDTGDFPLRGRIVATDGVDAIYAPRRRVLDKILVDAAVEAGAELREGFSVESLLQDGARVVGIRGQQAGSGPIDERARLVIGADGLHSLVARQVQAPVYQHRPSLTCSYYSYFSEVPVSGVELHLREGAFLVAFATHDDLVCVGVQVPAASFDAFRANIPGSFDGVLDRFPAVAERVRAGKRAERFQGTGELPNFYRRSSGPGWALVGDAGYHKDPITAQGISDAFRDAGLLAAAADAGLRGHRPLDEALAGYEHARDAASAGAYQVTVEAAALGPPPPPLQMLRAALRHNQPDTDQFVSAFAGAVSPATFFAPENLGRIMRGA